MQQQNDRYGKHLVSKGDKRWSPRLRRRKSFYERVLRGGEFIPRFRSPFERKQGAKRKQALYDRLAMEATLMMAQM
jgi:hypothetical protein